MGIKEEFTGTSLLGKIAFILLLVANFCNWIAFCTTEWGKRYINNNNDDIYVGYGIWRICGNQEVTSGCSRTDGWALNWYGAFQAFAIFGFMGINIAFLLAVLSMFVSQFKKNEDAGLASSIICFVAGACYLVSVIIFGARFDNTYKSSNLNPDLGYSFGLAIIALILAVIGGILIIVEAKKGGGTSPA